MDDWVARRASTLVSLFACLALFVAGGLILVGAIGTGVTGNHGETFDLYVALVAAGVVCVPVIATCIVAINCCCLRRRDPEYVPLIGDINSLL